MSEDDTMAELEPSKESGAKEQETVTVSKTVLDELQNKIAALEAKSGQSEGGIAEAILPGESVEIDKNAGDKTKAIYRMRESTEDLWEYILSVKKLKFQVDREKGYKVNIMKVVTIDEEGGLHEYEMADDDLAKKLEDIMVRLSDFEVKDMEYQDAKTPHVNAKRLVNTANPKSATGLEVQTLGKVKNMITYKKKSYKVHINDKVSYREESTGQGTNVLFDTITPKQNGNTEKEND